MSRNLKALGLALAAVFALGAVVASAAMAGTPRITTEGYPAKLVGEQVGKNNKLVLPGNRSIECEKIDYEAEYTEEEATKEEWSISVDPVYTNCHATILGNETPATVTTNGCYITFTDEETKTTTEQTGSAHLKCQEGKKIEVHVWKTTAEHEADTTPLCTYTIEEQGPLSSVTYKLSGPETNPHTYLTVSGEVHPTVLRSGGTLTNCGAASQEGKLTAEGKVEAFSEGEMVEGSMDPS